MADCFDAAVRGAAAGAAAAELYGYGHSNVLFKPTKATNNPFRPTGEDAMSYFVGADAMSNDKFKGEDAGFAINGGKGWSDVVFTNHQIELNGDTATAMGSYDFTDASSGDNFDEKRVLPIVIERKTKSWYNAA